MVARLVLSLFLGGLTLVFVSGYIILHPIEVWNSLSLFEKVGVAPPVIAFIAFYDWCNRRVEEVYINGELCETATAQAQSLNRVKESLSLIWLMYVGLSIFYYVMYV